MTSKSLQLLRTIMSKAVANQLTVMRAWAHSVDAPYIMETSPGVYNENVFRGLDYVLELARQNGLKVQILSCVRFTGL